MSRPAVILGHTASLSTPQDFERLEDQTGRKAMITGKLVTLVDDEKTGETNNEIRPQLDLLPESGSSTA